MDLDEMVEGVVVGPRVVKNASSGTDGMQIVRVTDRGHRFYDKGMLVPRWRESEGIKNGDKVTFTIIHNGERHVAIDVKKV
jgi:hypothetical protein